MNISMLRVLTITIEMLARAVSLSLVNLKEFKSLNHLKKVLQR